MPALPGGQMILLEGESDEALLMSHEHRVKIFTAAGAQKIEERLDPILTLIACRLSIARVAERCHISNHTVAALILQHGGRIAADMAEFAGWTAEVSAGFLALALQKAATELKDIPFKDLVAAHSFVGKLSLDMKVASAQLQIGVENPETLETIQADELLESAQKWAQARREAKPAEGQGRKGEKETVAA